MPLPSWLAPPRHLIALFLLVTLVPAILLMVFGWRIVLQNRALALQDVEVRREQAADLVVSALEQTLSAAAQSLRDGTALEAAASHEDIVAVVFTREGVVVSPVRRLPFYPVVATGQDAEPPTFARGEELEHVRRRFDEAAAVFRQLARSDDVAVRAGGLIRLARNLRKIRRYDDALAAYAEATRIHEARVGGVPADLLARWARCDLLASLNRATDLHEEAQRLRDDLVAGTWTIDRATYELHLADTRTWLGRDQSTNSANAEALADAVDKLWRRWTSGAMDHARSGREQMTTAAASTVVLWEASSERAIALVAGSQFVNDQWLTKLTPLLQRHNIRVALHAPTSRISTSPVSRRIASDTGLPWTIAVESTDLDAQSSRLAAQRAVWFAGLGILAALVIGGSAVVIRAVSRELAVARLQSDFVSAVSHEFRTPLTSLRQLTEILIDRPGTTADKRQRYYEALARQTERLHRLVESLLDFGRMEANTSPYRLTSIDACALVQTVVEQFEREAESRGYHVVLEMTGTRTVIAADREALTNALWNLLDNAVKYSPDCRTIWVSVSQEDRRLAIGVRDRGFGIPSEEQHRIFGKFVRGAQAKAENIRGTGIGLAMVQHIVRGHRGDVAVESEPGSGSTFTVRLPIEDTCLAS